MIAAGAAEVADIRVGNNQALAVYAGEELVWEAVPLGPPYLTFASQTAFELRHIRHTSKTWDGTLEYSTDNGSTWRAMGNGDAVESGPQNTILLRGSGNSVITSQDQAFAITGTAVSCSGNIETLLDWETVAGNGHPIPASYAFRAMFWGCDALISGPDLSTLVLSPACLLEFYYNCKGIEVLPRFAQSSFGMMACASMFYGCEKIKLSETQTGEYQTEYRLPAVGTGINAGSALQGMFTATGGAFRGTPLINTAYYTSNAVV